MLKFLFFSHFYYGMCICLFIIFFFICVYIFVFANAEYFYVYIHIQCVYIGDIQTRVAENLRNKACIKIYRVVLRHREIGNLNPLESQGGNTCFDAPETFVGLTSLIHFFNYNATYPYTYLRIFLLHHLSSPARISIHTQYPIHPTIQIYIVNSDPELKF